MPPLGVWWYLLCLVCGCVWTAGSTLGVRLTLGELLGAGLTVGTLGGAWVAYLAAMLIGRLDGVSISCATLLMVGAAAGRLPAARAALSSKRLRQPDAVGALLVGAFGVWLWPIYSSRMIPTDGAGNVVTAGSCYGDLPIHMVIAESFLQGANSDVAWGTRLDSPIFHGAPLTSPFVPDFHAAVIKRVGGGLRDGFLLPGFVATLSLVCLLYFFAWRVSRSVVGGGLAVCTVIFAGGTGGWRWWQALGKR